MKSEDFEKKYELGYAKIRSGTNEIKSGRLKVGKKDIEKGIKEGIEKAIEFRKDQSLLIESHIVNADRVLKEYRKGEKLLDSARPKQMNREQRIEDKLTLVRNLKRFEETLAQKRRIIRPDFKKLYNDKGIFLMSIKNYTGALKCFNTALKLYPKYEETIDNKKKLISILNKKQTITIDKIF